MSEREYQRRTAVNVDPAEDPTFNRPAGNLAGPLPYSNAPTVSRWRSRMFSEGPLGVSSRVAIGAKYGVYFLIFFGCSALTDGFLKAAGTTGYGGALMWFVATLMTVIAGVGALLQPTNREEIVQNYRHYTFGLCIIPSTAIAGIIWALRGVMSSPAAAEDTMAGLLNFAVAAVFICTLVIPPVVFVKLITGFHTMNRSSMTDTEMMAMVTRNDHLQR